ncbi:putative protein N(5)-glutamine methyltransferase [Nocardiopsis coralliicola]
MRAKRPDDPEVSVPSPHSALPHSDAPTRAASAAASRPGPDAPAGAAPDQLTALLRAAGCVFAEDEARLISAAAPDTAGRTALAARRAAGEPLEHVLGWAAFCDLRIAVGPGVFVPRRRTEFLAAQAIARCRPGSVAADLCCGAGNLAASLAAAVPGIELHASDIDPAATALAGATLSGAGAVYTGDLFDALPATLRGRIDVLVANAPYVPTRSLPTLPAEARDHEPPHALDGGPDGLDVHRRIIAAAPDWLAPGGTLLAEVAGGQAPAVSRAMSEAGLAAHTLASEEYGAVVAAGRQRG